MKNRKSPGNDGSAEELYAAFFWRIRTTSSKIILLLRKKGELSSSQKQAFAIFTKKKKDRRLVTLKVICKVNLGLLNKRKSHKSVFQLGPCQKLWGQLRQLDTERKGKPEKREPNV